VIPQSVKGMVKKGRWEDLRGSVYTFLPSRVSNVEEFSRLEGVHLNVDPRVLRVKNAACAAVRKRGRVRAVQGVGLVDDAQVLPITDLTLAGGAMSGGSGREGIGGGEREDRIGWSGIRGNNGWIGGLSGGDVGRSGVGCVVLRLGHGRSQESKTQGEWETHLKLYDLQER
jgi:hypothetical protein